MAGTLWEGFKGEHAPGGKVGIEESGREFGFTKSRLVGRWLLDGWLKAHPWLLVEGGLEGFEGSVERVEGRKGSTLLGLRWIRVRDTLV